MFLAFVAGEKSNDVVVLAQIVNHGGISLVEVDVPFRILPEGRVSKISDGCHMWKTVYRSIDTAGSLRSLITCCVRDEVSYKMTTRSSTVHKYLHKSQHRPTASYTQNGLSSGRLHMSE